MMDKITHYDGSNLFLLVIPGILWFRTANNPGVFKYPLEKSTDAGQAVAAN